jgi:hypothetical protein
MQIWSSHHHMKGGEGGESVITHYTHFEHDSKRKVSEREGT